MTDVENHTLSAPHPLVAELSALETIKTWSLIVTLFGDLDGNELTGAQIKSLLGHIGIKPETIRVSLHRLRSDGWIMSERRGREAVYRLSDKARTETRQATHDIYRRDIKHPGGWRFHVMPDGCAPEEAVAITRDVVLVPASMSAQISDSIALENPPQQMPPWFEERLVPIALLRNASALIGVLASEAWDHATVDKLDQIARRLLILHHWRRLALRDGTWAHISVLPGGTLSTCHAVVTRFLAESPRIRF